MTAPQEGIAGSVHSDSVRRLLLAGDEGPFRFLAGHLGHAFAVHGSGQRVLHARAGLREAVPGDVQRRLDVRERPGAMPPVDLDLALDAGLRIDPGERHFGFARAQDHAGLVVHARVVHDALDAGQPVRRKHRPPGRLDPVDLGERLALLRLPVHLRRREESCRERIALQHAAMEHGAEQHGFGRFLRLVQPAHEVGGADQHALELRRRHGTALGVIVVGGHATRDAQRDVLD